MRRNLLIIIALTIILSINLLFLYSKTDEQTNNIAGLKTKKSEIINSLFIGEFQFTLYGYTSPKALVSLNGQGIADQTIANDQGYFEFKNRYLPFSPNEACLTAQDQFGRISAPTCLPPFPKDKNQAIIGPVILPPTISLDKNQYYIGDEIILTGQTKPNSNVILSLFTESTILSKLAFLSPVNAFSLPKIEATSDSLGNFSISLPSNQSQNFRLFTQTKFEEKPSPQSILLTIKIYPIWMIIINFFFFIFNLIKLRVLELTIVIEFIVLIIYFQKTLFHPYYLKTRAIILREKNYLISKQPTAIIKREKNEIIKI